MFLQFWMIFAKNLCLVSYQSFHQHIQNFWLRGKCSLSIIIPNSSSFLIVFSFSLFYFIFFSFFTFIYLHTIFSESSWEFAANDENQNILLSFFRQHEEKFSRDAKIEIFLSTMQHKIAFLRVGNEISLSFSRTRIFFSPLFSFSPGKNIDSQQKNIYL